MNSLNNIEKFKNTLERGSICLGSVITLRDAVASELAAEAGYDFTWIDMEHAPITIETAQAHIMAVRGTATAPIVRVPWNDPVLIKPVLDLAPAGVIIPMVCTPEEAKLAVAACRYPTAGIRGLGVRRGVRYGATELKEYLQRVDDSLLVIIQFEHIKALECIDEILAVPGIGSLCIGPSDLSASMGRIGQPDHPDVLKVIERVAAAAKQQGLPLGVATGFSPVEFQRWLDFGVDWLAINSDCGSMFAQSQLTCRQARQLCRLRKGK